MSLNKAPDSSYEAQQVALALQEYIEAAHAERFAREKYEGDSWGYYGASFIDARDKAADTFTHKLNAYVDGRIIAAFKTVHGIRE